MYLVFSLAHADLLEVEFEKTSHALCLSPLDPNCLKPLGGELDLGKTRNVYVSEVMQTKHPQMWVILLVKYLQITAAKRHSATQESVFAHPKYHKLSDLLHIITSPLKTLIG